MKDTEQLLAAVVRRDFEEAKKLVNQGCDVNKKTKFNRSCFIEAILDNNIEMVEYMLKNGAQLDIKFEKGYTALHYVTKGGLADIAKLLLDAGANINIKDDAGNPPVWYSCAFWGTLPPDRSETLPILLKYKPDLTIINNVDRNPLVWRDHRIGLAEFLESVGI